MIKGFYFFDSYRSALKKYQEAGDDKSQVFLIHAICDYVFDGIEPEDFPRADLQVIWELLLPHLDNSIAIEKNRLQRQEAGRKGGKQNGSKTEANVKQNESKHEANTKQTESKAEASPKLNKNMNKNMNKNYFFKSDTVTITFEEAEAYKKEKGYASDLEQCKSYWELNGWTYKGLPLTDWQQVIDYWEKGYQKHKKKKSKSFDDFEQRFISDDDFKGLEKALMKGGTT